MNSRNAVTAAELGKKVIDLLGLKAGETFELAKTKDGQALVKKVVEPEAIDP